MATRLLLASTDKYTYHKARKDEENLLMGETGAFCVVDCASMDVMGKQEIKSN